MHHRQDLPLAPDRREFPGADAREDALLRHVVSTGSLWFAAAAVAGAVGLAGLLASGWRPRELQGLGDTVWWVGAALALAGAMGLAWAGCPVVSAQPGVAASRKSLSIRVGLVAFVAGMVLAALAVLLG